jgi:hypothetical protein
MIFATKKLFSFVKIILFIFFVHLSIELKSADKSPFVHNSGQIIDQYFNSRNDILYSSEFKGLNFFLKKDGFSYQVSKGNGSKEIEFGDQKIKTFENFIIHRLDINWLGCNKDAETEGIRPSNDYLNYYGTCAEGIRNVKMYASVKYHNLYENIDVTFYEKNGNLKYDYWVRKGSDYKKIQLQINGALKINVREDGSVILSTPLGDIIEEAPVVYQSSKRLFAKWILNDNILSFEIPNVDPEVPLVIDPVVRIWATYYGGSDNEYTGGVTTDNLGNVYLSGSTRSISRIATAGAYQDTITGGYDAFVAKFDSNGARLWATYYGGDHNDYGGQCAVDRFNNIYMPGQTETSTSSVIATPNAHQTSFGGWVDAFLIKFDQNGVRQWATFYGGPQTDYAANCATDVTGNIYLTGITLNSTGTTIATSGAHQPLSGGSIDNFLVKFNTNGTRLWGTYYGGNATDYSGGCNTDSNGNVYICGRTESTSGITTASGHQTTHGGGSFPDDGFLVKFDSNGVRQWGTYYGGTYNDYIYACVIDNLGNVFAVGKAVSTSANVISTPGSHKYISDADDGFIVKFNSNGIRLWGTYYGGSGTDDVSNCAVAPNGDIYVTGTTDSDDTVGIATSDGYQISLKGGKDAFLVKFNTNGQRLYGTYYGGVGSPETHGGNCAIEHNGGVYLAGATGSRDSLSIATPNSQQPSHGGSMWDGFLVKFYDNSIVGLNELIKNEIVVEVFPNPSAGIITVGLPPDLKEAKGYLLNSVGQVLIERNCSDYTEFNFKEQPSGIYFLRINSDNGVKTFKLVKD